MALYHCRIHTGPVGVKIFAQRLKAAKLKRVIAGTTQVHADVRAADQAAAEGAVIRAVKQKTGRTFEVVQHVVCNRRSKA